MRVIQLLAVAAVIATVFTAWAGPALANEVPAIDCQKAATPGEHVICAKSPLLVLDAETSTLYQVRTMVPMLMGERGNVHDDQVAFLKIRAACGIRTTCISSAYQARITTLMAEIQTAMDNFCKLQGLC